MSASRIVQSLQLAQRISNFSGRVKLYPEQVEAAVGQVSVKSRPPFHSGITGRARLWCIHQEKSKLFGGNNYYLELEAKRKVHCDRGKNVG